MAGNDGSEEDQRIFFQRSTDNGDTFSNAIGVNDNFMTAWLGNIVADRGNVYLTWRDGSTPSGFYDVFFRRSTDGGDNFTDKLNLSNSSDSSSRPHMSVIGSNVYVVWADTCIACFLGGSDIYFKRSTDEGAAFTNKAIKLSTNIGFKHDPQIAAESGTNSNINDVYVVWSDQTTANRIDDIFFRRSIDGGSAFIPPINSTAINLSNNIGKSIFPQITSQITASGNSNSVYIVWTDETTGNSEILFKGSIDNGTTFNNTPINLSDNLGKSIDPKIAAIVS